MARMGRADVKAICTKAVPEVREVSLEEENRMSESRCELCGHPMPVGEEMFKYHGYSGPCPAPPVEQNNNACADIDDPTALRQQRDELLDELKDLSEIYNWTPKSWETRLRMIRKLIQRCEGEGMSKVTIETTITRTYLRNKTKDEIIEHVMRLLSENDKLAAENLCWKGCTNNVRAVCEQAGYATRFGQDGVHVIGGTGIPRDLVDPVVEMATDLKQTRDALESLLFAVKQEPAMNNKKYYQLGIQVNNALGKWRKP